MKIKYPGSGTGILHVLDSDIVGNIENGKSVAGYIGLGDVPALADGDTIEILFRNNAAFSSFTDTWTLTYTDSLFKTATKIEWDNSRHFTVE